MVRYFGRIRGSTVRGYEIHMGQTLADVSAFEDDGCVNSRGNVIGTYLHGIFENPCIVDAVLSYACELKGLEYLRTDTMNDPYDDLADLVSSAVNINAIIQADGKAIVRDGHKHQQYQIPGDNILYMPS